MSRFQPVNHTLCLIINKTFSYITFEINVFQTFNSPRLTRHVSPKDVQRKRSNGGVDIFKFRAFDEIIITQNTTGEKRYHDVYEFSPIPNPTAEHARKTKIRRRPQTDSVGIGRRDAEIRSKYHSNRPRVKRAGKTFNN